MQNNPNKRTPAPITNEALRPLARRAVEKGARLVGQDPETVGRNLAALLAEAAAKGITRAKICEMAGIKPKHLNVFLPVKDGSRRTRLHQGLARYAAIAAAIARLAHIEEDDAYARLLSGTALLVATDDEPVEDAFVELNEMLDQVCRSIAKRHDLELYFRDIARVNPMLRAVAADEDDDVETATELDFSFDARRASSFTWPIEFGVRSDDQAMCLEDDVVPPYPSVVLGRFDLGGRMRVSVTAADREDQAPRFQGTTTAHVSAEIRLCIIPVGPEFRPEPALRVTIMTSLAGVPSLSDDPNAPDLISFAGEPLGIVPCDRPTEYDGWWDGLTDRPVGHMTVRADAKTAPKLLRTYFNIGDPLPYEWCKFFPIRPSICQDWLGIEYVDDAWGFDDKPPHIRILGPSLCEALWGVAGTTRFRERTVAAAVSRSLLDMQGWNLADMLEKRTCALLRAWELFMAELRYSEDEGRSKLQARVAGG